MTTGTRSTTGAAGATPLGTCASGSPIRPWSRPWLAATGAISVAALAVGALEARLPLGPGNTAVHHGYPFFAVSLALVLTLVAVRARRSAPRWAWLIGGLGTAYAVNALLIAALSFSVTPQGGALPAGALGWLADVYFPVCDIGFLGLMVGLLPDCRPGGRHRIAVLGLLALTVVTMTGEAVVPHTLDSTTLANPLGVSALSSLATVQQVLVPVVFLYAVVLSVVRGEQLARWSRQTFPGVAGPARGAGAVLLLTFVGQAAVPESSWYAAGAIVLAGGLLASLLAARVATTVGARSPDAVGPAR